MPTYSTPDIVSGSVTTVVATGTSITLSKPSGLADGDVIVVAFRSQGTGIPTFPSGWAKGGAGSEELSTDRGQGIYYKAITTASAETATTYAFGGVTSGRIVADIFLVRGVDLAHVNDGGVKFGTNTSNASSPSYSIGAVPSLLLELFADERTAGQSATPTTTPSGYTLVSNVQTDGSTNVALATTTGSRTAIWLGKKSLSISDSTTVAARAIAWPTGTTSPRNNSMSFRAITIPDPVTPAGLPMRLGDSSTGYLTYLDTDGVTRKTPANVFIWYPSFTNVAALLAKTNHPTMAHRGGSLVYPQFSSYAYDHSVFKGYGVLEMSVAWSSDGVPFGCGDQYLDMMVTGSAGSTMDPTTMTWAAISAYQNHYNPVKPGVYQPILRLDDFAAKYAKTHICIVDPKYGFATQTKINAAIAIMDAYGGPDRFIGKFDSPETDAKWSNSLAAKSYERMNYWTSDTTSMAAQQSRWTILGALYSDATAMAAANSYGKPSWAAIVPNAAGYATAVANGADLVMCTDPINIPAKSSWN